MLNSLNGLYKVQNENGDHRLKSGAPLVAGILFLLSLGHCGKKGTEFGCFFLIEFND